MAPHHVIHINSEAASQPSSSDYTRSVMPPVPQELVTFERTILSGGCISFDEK